MRPGDPRPAAILALAAIAATAATGTAADAGAADAATPVLQEVVVIGVPGRGGVPLDALPGNVYTLGSEALEAPGTSTLDAALDRRIAGVASVDALGSPLQQGLALRGFTASPLLGEPQGVVVFQGPMRANEAFGDVVQWDLLPVFAIASAQVITGSNPVYGPNSIGGAVALDMKTGFANDGASLAAAGGSFGRRTAAVEYGTHAGAFGLYAGADLVEEDGWRDHSPGRIRRGYADLAWRRERIDAGLGLTVARSRLTGNGPAPADLLATQRTAVFTYPDRTDSQLAAATVRVGFRPAAGITVDGGGYLRSFARSTLNGDRAEFSDCAAFVGRVPGFTPPGGAQCFGAEIVDDVVEGEPVVLLDERGDAITGLADLDAVLNATRTTTRGSGASAQLGWRAAAGARSSVLIAGASLDAADTTYRSGTQLATLRDDRGVAGLGTGIGNAEFNVALRSHGRLASLYASETYSPAARLHLTFALRWNTATLRLVDRIGTSLDGEHRYARLNPAFGIAWNATPALTAYASYTRNNRVPTPAELSCADPARACRFPNAFLSDPPLADVRVRTVEAGVRGRTVARDRALEYSVAAYTTHSRDDIVFISAGAIVGTGYFDNVAATRRQGFEASVSARGRRLAWQASYALVDATYQSPLAIRSPDNPGADAGGEIHVRPGDRLPSIPRHSLKAGIAFDATAALTLGAEVAGTSSRYLRGDEANLGKPLGGYLRCDASARYRRGRIEWYARVDNVFDARYDTFGVYADPADLGFGSPRFISPGAPRTFVLGLRARR